MRIGATQAGDHRHVVPVEMELDNRRLPLQRPGPHPCGAFADTVFVDEDDQSAFAPGFFLSGASKESVVMFFVNLNSHETRT